jgi:hypothetical protein
MYRVRQQARRRIEPARGTVEVGLRRRTPGRRLEGESRMTDHDDEVVIARDGEALGGRAAIAAIIIVMVIVLAAGWYFLMGPGYVGGGGETTNPTDINVDVDAPAPPAEGG